MLPSIWSLFGEESYFAAIVLFSLCGYLKGADASLTSETHPSYQSSIVPSIPDSSSTKETHVCYWCGPLADQVHRSTRAPLCTEPRTTVQCDPGYNYCAIVATSPPHEISKYCVKLYQDECYSSFCNTTNKWKVICPCKGNLCNNDINVREQEAFKKLTRAVYKTHNIKLEKRSIPESEDNKVDFIDSTNITSQFVSEHVMTEIESIHIEDIQDNNVSNNIDSNQELDKDTAVKIEKVVDTLDIELRTDVISTDATQFEVTKMHQDFLDVPKPEEELKPDVQEDNDHISIIKPTEDIPLESLQQGDDTKPSDAVMSTTSETEDVTTTESMLNLSEPEQPKRGKNIGIALGTSIAVMVFMQLFTQLIRNVL